jgi:predicted dehydrogenase
MDPGRREHVCASKLMSREARLALYGTGDMAASYLDALLHLGNHADAIVVVGRDLEKANILATRYGARAAALGNEAEHAATIAIVAVTPDALSGVARQALQAGARKLLIEKPGALSSSELARLGDALATAQATGYVAYNRRFYPSAERCRALIREDGGAVACFLEMTEIEQRVLLLREKPNWSDENFARWGIVNSTHVLDLATWLVGCPTQLSTHRDGRLAWHPSGATFFGTGKSDAGAALVYLATWGAAGRWRIEVTTPKRRLIMCPLEALDQQIKDSFSITRVDIRAEPSGTKPGLDGLLRAFLSGNRINDLPSLMETVQLLATAEKIFGYV